MSTYDIRIFSQSNAGFWTLEHEVFNANMDKLIDLAIRFRSAWYDIWVFEHAVTEGE